MFRFFRKDPEPVAEVALQLISIHIPKTAGTSFRNTLCGVYGQDAVVRLDIGLIRQETMIREQVYDAPELPPGIAVLHGHFSYPRLTERFPIDPALPVITWLRDPVERVISNYFYLAKRLAEELNEEGRGLNILNRMQRTLLEYARYEPAQNRISKFLEGLALEDLHFVGLVEHYDEDLARLATLMGWPEVPVFTHNRTGKDTSIVTDAEREEIRALNTEDVALYEKALALREKGRWAP
jgi:hypothetical protein